MASSEDKRHRQSLRRQSQNQSTKSRVKTLVKKVIAAAAGKDPNAEEQLRVAMSAIHKAGRKRVLHPNTAARRIARLSRLVHQSKSAAQASETSNS
ncbi:MAG: 30S ribosomal protein S20 [Candidatus Binatia bacterium]